MKILIVLVTLGVCACIAPQAYAEDGLDAQKILAASDAVRNPAKPF